MAINAGKYNVFNEDGTLFKWGDQSVHVSVTINHRVQFFIGDNAEPITEKNIPKRIHTLNDFDKFTRGIFQASLVMYATRLVIKLHKFQEVYQQIIDQKSVILGQMMLGALPVWRWIERMQELNQFQETCETLMMEYMGELHSLAPNMLTDQFTIIFTEG